MNANRTCTQRVAVYVSAMLIDRRNASRPYAKFGLLGAALAVVAACSPAPMPISTSSHDPSNPSAPEGVTPPLASSSAPKSSPPAAGHDEHRQHEHAASASDAPAADAGTRAAGDAGSQNVVYVCPMHPEVTSTTPGVCPKCNMKLVPKK